MDYSNTKSKIDTYLKELGAFKSYLIRSYEKISTLDFSIRKEYIALIETLIRFLIFKNLKRTVGEERGREREKKK